MELLPCQTALFLSVGQSMALVVRVSPIGFYEPLSPAMRLLIEQQGAVPPLIDMNQFSENLRLLQESLASLSVEWNTPREEDRFDIDEYLVYPPSPTLTSSSVSVSESESCGGAAMIARGQGPSGVVKAPRSPRKRQPPRPGSRQCQVCNTNKTSQWREAGTLCNVCALRKRRRVRRLQKESRT
jgi:hypothetical protein